MSGKLEAGILFLFFLYKRSVIKERCMCRALQLCERGWMRKGKCRLSLSVPNRRPSTFDEVVPAFFCPHSLALVVRFGQNPQGHRNADG